MNHQSAKMCGLFMILALVFTGCPHEKVMLNLTVDGVTRQVEVDADVKSLVFASLPPEKIDMIEGLEKLARLEKLRFSSVRGFSDYSFIKDLSGLKALVLTSCNIDNLDFLKNLPRLEVLVLDLCDIADNRLDLSGNPKLVYISLWCVTLVDGDTGAPRVTSIDIRDVPEGLKYINFSGNLSIILSDAFLQEISAVPVVIMSDLVHAPVLDEEHAKVVESYRANAAFFSRHPNFIFRDPAEVLPADLREYVFPPSEKPVDNILDRMRAAR